MHSLRSIIATRNIKAAREASGVQATGAKRFRDIAFIVVSAPPPAEQVIHLKDVAPKPESSWRGGLNRTPMCLEEKVVASVQARSAREQGVGVAGGGVVCSPWISVALPHDTPSPQLNPAFPPQEKEGLATCQAEMDKYDLIIIKLTDGTLALATRRAHRESDVVCQISGLCFDSKDKLEQFLSTGGNRVLQVAHCLHNPTLSHRVLASPLPRTTTRSRALVRACMHEAMRPCLGMHRTSLSGSTVSFWLTRGPLGLCIWHGRGWGGACNTTSACVGARRQEVPGRPR